MPTLDELIERKENYLETKQEYLYTENNFPCLVRGGASLETLPDATDLDAYYHVNARNALRNLTYGTSLFKGSLLSWPNLKLAWLNFKALGLKRDAKLLDALRDEMKIIFENAYQISTRCDSEAEKRLEIFVNTLLSNFPFMDPVEGEAVVVPQKIKGKWSPVTYQFHKIDLSPKTGLWSKLIEEEDRLYAYGMETQDLEASPYLLLMGTTYFSGQGAGFSLLGDLTAGQSVGERHDLTALKQWIQSHQKIKISGHSQGGTMALLVAALYPDFVLQVDSLNPAALHQSTARKLLRSWESLQERKPELRVFTQRGDPVFIFGDAFLPGTRLLRVDHSESAKDSLLSAHAHHYSGHRSAYYTELDESVLRRSSNKRKFFNDLKAVADRILGPLLSLNLGYFILKRKLWRFCSQEARILRALLFFAGLGICLALLATGLLAPSSIFLALPFLQGLSPILSYSLLALSSAAASVFTAAVLPKLIRVTVNLSQFTVGTVIFGVVGVILGVSSIAAGCLALKRACMRQEPADPLSSDSTCHSFIRLGCTRSTLITEARPAAGTGCDEQFISELPPRMEMEQAEMKRDLSEESSNRLKSGLKY